MMTDLEKRSAGVASPSPWDQAFRLPSRRLAGPRQLILRIGLIWGRGAPVAVSLRLRKANMRLRGVMEATPTAENGLGGGAARNGWADAKPRDA
jgi:hypothetical protein